jgi:hypothetical protein
MNSHQRRKFDRKWKHSVVIYIDRWSKHVEIREWCEKNFGKIGHRWSNVSSYTPFVFKNEQDAVLFAMRWA